MTLAERLAQAVEHLPPGSSITLPVDWLREELEAVEGPTATISDLTVEDFAAELERKPSTVRAWLGSGAIPEAYKLGRQWRVPRAAVRRYLDSLSTNGAGREADPCGDVQGHQRGAWQRHYKGAS